MEELSQIIIKAKKDIYTYLSGTNQSNFLGHGYDFAELDEYMIGDDIRNISWINSASKGNLYIKKMHEEKELNITCCALIDGRMVVDNKYKTLLSTLASIGYLANIQNDILKPIFFYKDEIKIYPIGKNKNILHQYLSDISQKELLGTKIDYTKITNRLLETIKEKSLIFIVGDFLDNIDLSILAQKHEIIAIIIRGKSEEDPSILSNTQLINPQTLKSSTQTLNQKSIKYYKVKLKEHDDKLFEHFQNYNIRYSKIYNANEIVKIFSKILL